MPLVSKNDRWADKSLFSGYQEYLVTFKSMTSKVVQRPRPLLFKGLRLKVASENLKRYFELSLPLTRLIAVYSNAY